MATATAVFTPLSSVAESLVSIKSSQPCAIVSATISTGAASVGFKRKYDEVNDSSNSCSKENNNLSLLLSAIDFHTSCKRISIESLIAADSPLAPSQSPSLVPPPHINIQQHQQLQIQVGISDMISDTDSDASISETFCSDAQMANGFSTLEIWFPKCCQKSYGNEKRFLCPPPAVRPSHLPYTCNFQVDGVSIVDREAQQFVSENVASTPLSAITSSVGGDRSYYFRNLHVSSLMKSCSLNVSFRTDGKSMQLSTGSIQIISKPSKKSKSLKYSNSSSFISLFDNVSLYNRINNQTVRTKFLTGDPKQSCLIASNTDWSPLQMVLVHSRHPGSSNLHFGDVIRFVSNSILSPEFQVRKAEKNSVQEDFDGPVGQMHKIALYNPETKSYLSTLSRLQSNSQLQGQSNTCATQMLYSSSEYPIEDSCLWTIITVECLKSKVMPLHSLPSSASITIPRLIRSPKVSDSVLTVTGVHLDGVKFWKSNKYPLRVLERTSNNQQESTVQVALPENETQSDNNNNNLDLVMLTPDHSIAVAVNL